MMFTLFEIVIANPDCFVSGLLISRCESGVHQFIGYLSVSAKPLEVIIKSCPYLERVFLKNDGKDYGLKEP